MRADTTYLQQRIGALERSLERIGLHEGADDFLYEIYRTACVKEFELVLEQSGKLLRKRIAEYFASNRQADCLTFRDLFRHAARHGLIETDVVERWLGYRDNRNDMAHDFGEGFSEATPRLLPSFIVDAKVLADMIEEAADD